MDPTVPQIREFIEPYRVRDGRKFRLKNVDPADTAQLGGEDKDEARDLLQGGVQMLAELQERLYATDRWALLLIFQAMDAAGKDSTIKHVMSGVNPQGCEVFSFKSPSPEELDHDFLWRCAQRLPERGRIGIFNRSYYEEVLIVRVHKQLLKSQHIPPELVGRNIWKQRYQDINAFERYLSRNGIAIRKFFLHVSAEEQAKRFLARLDEPEKNWKFSLPDARERRYWDEYQKAYEKMIRRTSSEHAPWFVVPADNKWFTQLVVAGAAIDALVDMKLEFPEVDAGKRQELNEVRAYLQGELAGGRSDTEATRD